MKKRNFSTEFKRESAQLVVDQKYTVADAAKAMDVGLSTMTRSVKQLRDERQGKTPKASPITPNNTGAPMKKRNFSAEFKRESAQLVVDQKYTVADAAKAMDVGLSTMTRWVKQLRDERQGKTPKASPITPEQIEIRKLRKKLQRIEMENEILKKATALLMSDSLNSSR